MSFAILESLNFNLSISFGFESIDTVFIHFVVYGAKLIQTKNNECEEYIFKAFYFLIFPF